jgi:uncharacterized membrane protein
MEYLILLVLAGFVWRMRASGRDLHRRLTASELELSALRRDIQVLGRRLGPAPGQPEAPRQATPPPQQAQVKPEEAPAAPVSVPPFSAPPFSVPSVSGQPAPVEAPARSLEERLGAGWSVWVGGLALALGGLLLVRYSIEQGLIGPHVRIALGALLALALAGAGEYLRRSEQRFGLAADAGAHIPGVLTGAATVVAFGTTYASHALYGFLDAGPAFVLLAALGLVALLAAALHGPAQAGVGLIASFVAPLLVSSSTPNPWPVVGYLAIVAAAAYALARLRSWPLVGVGAVAGAFAWGIVLTMLPASQLLATVPAQMTHALIQLALGAYFLCFVPFGDTADDDAWPDPIAAIGMLALVVMTIAAIGSMQPRLPDYVPLIAVALAILAATGMMRAPAAFTLLLAGLVTLAAMLIWPGLGIAPKVPFTREMGEFMRLPESVSAFLVFAAVASGAVALAAHWRLMRGAALPLATAGIYAPAVTLPPMLALVLAYLRVTQFDHSIPFALAGAALAVVLAGGAETYVRRGGTDPAQATRLATGALAAAAIAALALALTAALDRGYLTVALALAALGAAYVATMRDIPALRYAVTALGAIVLARVMIDPRIMGETVGATPILNWLLFGYGVPAAAFWLSARLLRQRAGEGDASVRLSEGLAVVFAALLVTWQIRHFLYNGNPLHPGSGHVELGLQTTAAFGLSYVLSRLDLARANPVFMIGSMALGVIAITVAIVGLGVVQNPLLSQQPVAGGTFLSSLVLGYLLPGLMAAFAARAARGVRPLPYVTAIAVTAVLLLFGYVTLEVRHAFQGEVVHWTRATGGAEHWAYSLAWLGLGLVILAYGFWQASKPARIASAALVLLAVLKVFLFDLAGLTGLWRPLSFITLGIVLIGIGMAYQRLLFPAKRKE